ncbi:MAG: hypothetical protein ABWJ42_07045 [Sulfolobales archaeon]
MSRRVVLFIDLDNTLIKNPLGFSVLPKVYRFLSDSLGVDYERAIELFKEVHLEIFLRDPLRSFDWDFIVEEILRRYSIKKSFSVLEEQLRSCEKAYLLGDIIETLRKLEEKSYLMILSTNGLLKYQKCLIERLGLERSFNLIFTPDIRGCIKSMKCFYELHSLEDEYTRIAIGDDILFDVYYPCMYNMKTIHIKRYNITKHMYLEKLNINPNIIKANATIDDFNLVPSIIDNLIDNR